MLRFGWLTPLFNLVHRILDYWEVYKRNAVAKKRQEKRDKAADNPGDAFTEHFGRMPEHNRDDAGETNQTDLDSSGESK